MITAEEGEQLMSSVHDIALLKWGLILKEKVASKILFFNPLFTGGLFHCYMLDKSICHFRRSGLFCRFYSILDGKSFKQTM